MYLNYVSFLDLYIFSFIIFCNFHFLGLRDSKFNHNKDNDAIRIRLGFFKLMDYFNTIFLYVIKISTNFESLRCH